MTQSTDTRGNTGNCPSKRESHQFVSVYCNYIVGGRHEWSKLTLGNVYRHFKDDACRLCDFVQFAGIGSLADCTAGTLYSLRLQSPKDIGMRSEGGYDTVPLDQAQRDDIHISNGYYMQARFDQNLTAGSFQGLLQRRGVQGLLQRRIC